MFEDIVRFYENQMVHYTRIRESLRKKIYQAGTIRLFLFIALLVTVWFFRNEGWITWLSIFLIYAIPFAILMVYHTKLSGKRAYAEHMIDLNTNERKGIDYDFSAFDGAAEQVDAQHSFSLDLDMFGNHSLFQSINRTVTVMGKSRLINWFTNPLTYKDAIIDRQHAVRELASKTDFRQLFYVTGINRQGAKKDVRQLNELSAQTTHFSESLFWKIMIWLIPVIWLIVIAGLIWAELSFGVLGIVFAISFVIANIQTKRISKLHNTVDRMNKLLYVYSRLMKLIEKENFLADNLKHTQQSLLSKGLPASQTIRQLSGIIGGLDQRFNMALIILNILYLRDIRHVMALEKWIKAHVGSFDAWFDALAQVDALCSLGNFSFNHPGYACPEIADHYFQMEGKALGHPLLNRKKCVRNDISITKNPYFLVVTGANMAGKSTYLRTVGVNFLLACIGAPVCAESLVIYPAHLVTSLRTADSLTANESYFFAELKRLKMMIDRLNNGEELFIILDEILKGTNSKDKQKGSLALVKQLITKKTCGIIATHDLLLGTLEAEFPGEIKNYRFEADITNDELTFSYQLREGVAQNMNASFLMKKFIIVR